MNSSQNVRKQVQDVKKRMSGATQSVITSVNADTDMIRVDAGNNDTSISHPFASKDAWIRSMPSTGTRVTVQYNTAAKKYDFVAYVPLSSVSELAKYRERKSLYRILREGEHEIKSIGGAVSYWGTQKYQSTRAGVVKSAHDGERLEHFIEAPTISVRGHRYRNDRLGNEKRFGVVKRTLTSTQETIVLKAPTSMPDTGSFVYAYENLLLLRNDNDAPLLDFREGEVYDDLPQPGYPFSLPALGKNGFPLRVRRRYHSTLEPLGTEIPSTYTEEEIDNFGNQTWTFAKTAVLGLAIRIPYGGYSMNATLKADIVGKAGVSISSTVGSVSISGTAGISNNTPAKYSVNAKSGVDIDTPVVVNIHGGTSVVVKSDGKVKVSGKLGVDLAGILGGTGRPVATQPTCFVTNLPLSLDSSVTA